MTARLKPPKSEGIDNGSTSGGGHKAKRSSPKVEQNRSSVPPASSPVPPPTNIATMASPHSSHSRGSMSSRTVIESEADERYDVIHAVTGSSISSLKLTFCCLCVSVMTSREVVGMSLPLLTLCTCEAKLKVNAFKGSYRKWDR